MNDYDIGYDEGYKHGRCEAMEKRVYTLYVSKSGNSFRAKFNNRNISSNEDYEQMQYNAGRVINEMHKALGLPEILMANLVFTKHIPEPVRYIGLSEVEKQEAINKKNITTELRLAREAEYRRIKKQKNKEKAAKTLLAWQLKNKQKKIDNAEIIKYQEGRRLLNIEKRALNAEAFDSNGTQIKVGDTVECLLGTLYTATRIDKEYTYGYNSNSNDCYLPHEQFTVLATQP